MNAISIQQISCIILYNLDYIPSEGITLLNNSSEIAMAKGNKYNPQFLRICILSCELFEKYCNHVPKIREENINVCGVPTTCIIINVWFVRENYPVILWVMVVVFASFVKNATIDFQSSLEILFFPCVPTSILKWFYLWTEKKISFRK